MAKIGDYALIGDCHSAALVSRNGSVEWACFPRFDSPAVFCGILDARRGGYFSLSPEKPVSVRRRYVDDTNVLVTLFRTQGGELEVTDCMPVRSDDPRDPSRLKSHHAILRRARCVRGEVDVRAVVAPRFEYGAIVPRFSSLTEREAAVVGGADAVYVTATRPLVPADDALRGRWSLAAGEEVWIECRWCRADAERRESPAARVFERRLDETVDFWQRWMSACVASGEHAGLMRRSALVLKALTFAPTGAVVAAPTTSLPEQIGGGRNWDYRYTWIRDSTLTLTSLLVTGFGAEASAFKEWLERTGAGRPEHLQIMYAVKGRRSLPEVELTHLEGFAKSSPVRIGNGAAGQKQLDSYGQVLEAAWMYGRLGGTLTEENWRVLSGYAEQIRQRWREPDQGIWEVRDEPRHFLHSKLHCWLGLERAVRMAQKLDPGPVARWTRERDAIERAILEDVDARGWFSQALGTDLVDASALVVPAVGFLPARDPRVQRTVEVVRRDLERGGGLLYRYRSPDGLEGEEGAFLLCSFWLVDALAHGGRIDEAQAVLERLLSLANDVGLFAEEADPDTGDALGNFPQAFTHMALITSCAHVAAVRRGESCGDERADFAAFLVDRTVGTPAERLATGAGLFDSDATQTVRIRVGGPAPASGGGVQLAVVEGSCRGQVFDLDGPEIKIGRRRDCDLVLDAKTVSKIHARFFLDAGRYRIEDLESSNGTAVNGTRLSPGESHLLCHGDTVLLGDQLLVFRTEGGFRDREGRSTIDVDSDTVRREADDLLRDLPEDRDRS